MPHPKTLIIYKSTVFHVVAGFAAIMLMLGILSACGGGGDSEAEETVPDMPSTVSQPDSSALPTDSQPVPSENGQDGQEGIDPPEEDTPAGQDGQSLKETPETTALESHFEELAPEEQFETSLGPALEELYQVIEEELFSEEDRTDPVDISVIVSDGEIVQGETRYEVAIGESIAIEVFSSQFDHEVHVHGYDLKAFAGPITPARFEFMADLPGTWEVEFEATHDLMFELGVR